MIFSWSLRGSHQGSTRAKNRRIGHTQSQPHNTLPSSARLCLLVIARFPSENGSLHLLEKFIQRILSCTVRSRRCNGCFVRGGVGRGMHRRKSGKSSSQQARWINLNPASPLSPSFSPCQNTSPPPTARRHQGSIGRRATPHNSLPSSARLCLPRVGACIS